MYSQRERTAHVVRRLGIGANPRLVMESESPEDAIAKMADLPFFSASPPDVTHLPTGTPSTTRSYGKSSSPGGASTQPGGFPQW
jgi:hypothetical protein